MLTIRHPDIEATGTCTQEQFDLLYKARGFSIVPEAEAKALEGSEATSLDELTKDELAARAAALGVDLAARATKAEMIAAIEAATTETGA